VKCSITLAIKCQLPPETEGFQIYRNPKFIHDRMVNQDHQYVRIKGPYSVRRSTLTCHELTSWSAQALNFETLSSSGKGGKVSQINIASYLRRLKSLSTAQRVLRIPRFLHKTYDVFVLGRLRMLIFITPCDLFYKRYCVILKRFIFTFLCVPMLSLYKIVTVEMNYKFCKKIKAFPECCDKVKIPHS